MNTTSPNANVRASTIPPTTTSEPPYDPEGAIVFIVVVILFYGLSIPCLIGIFITSKKENVPYDEQRDYQKEINQVRAIALRMERLRTLKRAIKHRGSLVQYEDSPSLKFARVTLGSSSSEPSMTPTLTRSTLSTDVSMTSSTIGHKNTLKEVQSTQNERDTAQRLNVIQENPLESIGAAGCELADSVFIQINNHTIPSDINTSCDRPVCTDDPLLSGSEETLDSDYVPDGIQ